MQSKEQSLKNIADGKKGFHEEAYEKLNNQCIDAWRRPLTCSWISLWISAAFYACVTMVCILSFTLFIRTAKLFFFSLCILILGCVVRQRGSGEYYMAPVLLFNGMLADMGI